MIVKEQIEGNERIFSLSVNFEEIVYNMIIDDIIHRKKYHVRIGTKLNF